MSIPFAIIGLGHIGSRHAALVRAHPRASLVATCDPHKPADFTSLDALLDSGTDFEVACICTPNGLHAPQALRLLEAGKHVVIEKPIALTVAEGDAIIATAERYGKTVFGVMQNRYSPASAWLKRLLGTDRLGDVLQVHLDCFWNRDARYYRLPDGRPHPWHGDAKLDGGVLFTQFAHFIDLLCWCCGRPEIHAVQLRNQTHRELHPFADTGSVQFSIGSILGSMNFSTVIWGQNFESTLTVIGTRGTVKLGGQYMNELRYCRVENLDVPNLPPSNPANNYGPYTGSAANHHFVIDNVVGVLEGRETVATTAREGRDVVATIAAIYAAGGA